MKHEYSQKGSVVIYMVLLLFMVMTSSAIVLSGVLSKHIRSAGDYLASERAFSAAHSAVEELYFDVARTNSGSEITKTGEITFDDGSIATYEGTGKRVGAGACLAATGTYKSTVRRITLGGGLDGCPSP